MSYYHMETFEMTLLILKFNVGLWFIKTFRE